MTTSTDGDDALHAVWLTDPPTDAGGAPPVVLLHGFTQNAGCWGPFGAAIAAAHPTLAVDAPGHGGSAEISADLPAAADLLAATIEEASTEPVVVIGYSMGGRLALHLALRRPEVVRALVLIGATGGIDDDVDRAARRAADDALAEHLLAVGLEMFIDEWLAQPLFAGLTPETACRDQRLENTPEGLASSLRLAGTGTQLPLWHELDAMTMPTLALAGVRDAKFCALGERLAAAIGRNATIEVIEQAGHAVHLERPEETAATIERWLPA